MITVHGTNGHQFIDTDGPTTEKCLVCGAWYNLEPGDDGHYYRSHTGDEPTPCTRDTSIVHALAGEGVCQVDNGAPCGDDDCPHVHHDCNCLMCV